MRKFGLFGQMGMATKVSFVLWTFGFSLVAGIITFRGQTNIVLAIATQAPLWAIALCLSRGLQLLWRRLSNRAASLRWVIMAVAGLLVGAVLSLNDMFFLKWLGQLFFPAWAPWAQDISLERYGRIFILYTWTAWLNITLFWALSSAESAKEQERRAKEAEAATQAAQLAMLRLQLNPHFLFNTLNAISAMVMERDVVRADQMIERLSDFLRSSLTTDPNALILLGEEFDTIEAYLEIEAVRFEGRLDVRFRCEEPLRAALVPGFILQPLVENAMKYAVTPALRLVTVMVEARAEGDELILLVSDDGDPVAAATKPKGHGVGLGNTRARLANLYGEAGRLTAQQSDTGFKVEVRMPLVIADAQVFGPPVRRVAA